MMDLYPPTTTRTGTGRVVDTALFVDAAVAAVTLSEYDFDYHDDDMGGSGSFGDDVVNVLGRGCDDSGIDGERGRIITSGIKNSKH